MKKGKKLYEGKAKVIYSTNTKGLAIQYFKDDATAFNNQKKSKIEGKGVLNNRISEYILENLAQIGIKTHLVKRLNMREQIIKLASKYISGSIYHEKDASESWVKRNINKYDIIHFASHSTALSENYYQECGVILNGDNQNDGFLIPSLLLE